MKAADELEPTRHRRPTRQVVVVHFPSGDRSPDIFVEAPRALVEALSAVAERVPLTSHDAPAFEGSPVYQGILLERPEEQAAPQVASPARSTVPVVAGSSPSLEELKEWDLRRETEHADANLFTSTAKEVSDWLVKEGGESRRIPLNRAVQAVLPLLRASLRQLPGEGAPEGSWETAYRHEAAIAHNLAVRLAEMVPAQMRVDVPAYGSAIELARYAANELLEPPPSDKTIEKKVEFARRCLHSALVELNLARRS